MMGERDMGWRAKEMLPMLSRMIGGNSKGGRIGR